MMRPQLMKVHTEIIFYFLDYELKKKTTVFCSSSPCHRLQTVSSISIFHLSACGRRSLLNMYGNPAMAASTCPI